MRFGLCAILWASILGYACISAAPAASQEPANVEAIAPENTAVAAILATNPSTPLECLRAAKNLADLGHADAAKGFIKNVLDAKLDEEQLAELGEAFGVAPLLEMTGHSALLPEAKQLADAVAPAVRAKLEAPARIEMLIAQLQDTEPQRRIEALAGLQQTGRAAINPLLAVLADPARTAEHENVRTVLAGMGRTARQALAAALDAADPKLQTQAILTLAELNDRKAMLSLLMPCVSDKSDADVRAAAAAALQKWTGHVPTRPEAIRLLAEAANNCFAQRQPIEGVEDGKVERWRWDAEAGQCLVETGSPADALRVLAARYAKDAYALNPEDRRLRLLYLTTMLDEAAHASGLDRPLESDNPIIKEAKKFGVKPLDEVLAFAIEQNHPAAAAAAARLLGEIGTADEVLYQGAERAPLARALRHPDRRLRMAALKAIVQLRPAAPYAGSSDVPLTLDYFAAGCGTRRALVAGANIEQSRDLAGVLAEAGLQTDTVASGKEAMRLATGSPDYECVWIDVSISRPQVGTVLHELRQDPRTALLPVGLAARSGCFDLAERLARTDPLSRAFVWPRDEQATGWQFEQLQAVAPDAFVDAAVRQQQAAEALDLLAELSRSSNKLYDLRRAEPGALAALQNPKLAVKAADVLAEMNSAESQRALVDAASRFTLPLELRKAAASAFCTNRERHGLLLTSEEIREQYRRYNESEQQDAATQKILGLILDCIEVSVQK